VIALSRTARDDLRAASVPTAPLPLTGRNLKEDSSFSISPSQTSEADGGRDPDLSALAAKRPNATTARSARGGPQHYYLLWDEELEALSVPPLREHPEDIPLLVEHFIEFFNEKLQPRIAVRGIEESAIAAMAEYPWPRNVRELSNSIEGAFTFGRAPMIRLQDLPIGVAGSRPQRVSQTSNGASREAASTLPIGSFAEAERALIARALNSTDGNKVAAAALLRISRKKLYAKIEKYGI
jgi:transcriptional regulator of acetoin/glycerol metabolism